MEGNISVNVMVRGGGGFGPLWGCEAKGHFLCNILSNEEPPGVTPFEGRLATYLSRVHASSVVRDASQWPARGLTMLQLLQTAGCSTVSSDSKSKNLTVNWCYRVIVPAWSYILMIYFAFFVKSHAPYSG